MFRSSPNINIVTKSRGVRLARHAAKGSEMTHVYMIKIFIEKHEGKDHSGDLV
jgi:hypothetical protein